MISCTFPLGEAVAAGAVTAEVRRALVQSDLAEGESPIALSFPWQGDPSHARLHAVAAGIV